MDAEKVGNAIKILRTRIGYTQHDLADVMGVTDKAVSKWERGLSVPDIANISRLSLILNCDVDNLLEGNISYLEKKWQGLLKLEADDEEFVNINVYGKPAVYFPISYFMLAGIREIYIICSDKSRKEIENRLMEEGDLGIMVHFISCVEQLPLQSTMVVEGLDFIYGPNLTRYFQRAMSRPGRISCLTINKRQGENSVEISNNRAIRHSKKNSCFCTGIRFVPEEKMSAIRSGVEDLIREKAAFAEPMGNGMIEFRLEGQQSILFAAELLHLLKETMGTEIYDLRQIAKNRNMIQ